MSLMLTATAPVAATPPFATRATQTTFTTAISTI